MAKSEINMEIYPVKITLPVLWGHMDAFQHVNNVMYFRYLESARIEYFEKSGLMKLMFESGIGPILAETTCRYLKPLRFPDTIDVGCRTTKVGSSDMEQEYAVYSYKQARIVALGWGLIVAYDYQSLKRATFPSNFFEQIRSFDNGAVIEG